ncbi:MAG: HD domain-containing protein [Anaerobutyricum sp.]
MHHQKEQKKNSDIDIIKIDDKEKAKKWRHIQNEIYDYVKNIFRFDNLNLINKNISKSELFVVQNAILGIMITSDWIASNNYVFDNQSYKNIDEFLESRKLQALKFLNNEGLIRQQIPVMQDFRSAFGFNGRPVQNDVGKIVHKNDIKCMLIESGLRFWKNRGGISAAAVLGNRSGLSGIYMGLPTGVSAEAIQDRVDEFLTSHGMRNTKLYTSKSMLLRSQIKSRYGRYVSPEIIGGICCWYG